MKSFGFARLFILGTILVLLQVTLFQPWAWLNVATHLSLLLVMIATVQTDWRSGIILGALIGGFYQIFSPFPFWIHPFSFMLAAGAAWIFRRHYVTSRTGLSLLVSILGGTAIYYTTVAILILTNKVFNGAALTPVWPVWLTAVAWQLVMHPFLAGVWWVVTGQRQAALHVKSW